ncbi:MAG: TlpA family protein disulfide reductase [Candidatus Riflebacteria bacterium]|nr:TlpA family protein disulfide reductase [Candidatus Riflebacteria bacterium]
MQLMPLQSSSKSSFFRLLLLTMILVSSICSAQETADGNKSALSLLQPGSSAPINTLKDISGEERSYPLPAKWNLVFYWSLFCHSCIEEMPEIQEGLSKLEGKDFATFFVSLDTEKMQKALQNFKKRRKFPAPILMEKVDNEKYVSADSWGVTMTPSVFIVNPEGKIIFSHQGPLDLDLFFKNLPKELVGSSTIDCDESDEDGVIIDEQ